MSTAYLLTGSNIGDSAAHLAEARRLIAGLGDVVKASSVYRTQAWGNTHQQAFLNQALCIETTLDPDTLMQRILETEAHMGRVREQKWEPRIIDIDILFYEDRVIRTELLSVPHPLLHERRFTLEPLNEIAPGLLHPVLGQSIAGLLASCPDHSVVEKL